MLEKPADKFIGVERHQLGLAVMAIIHPSEGNRLLGDLGDPGVGDGDAVGDAVIVGWCLSVLADSRTNWTVVGQTLESPGQRRSRAGVPTNCTAGCCKITTPDQG
jgi:hypothetical protein